MNVVTAATAAEWRAWLDRHGETATEVWLVIQHKRSPVPGVGYAEAIEHALCHGWIDSHARKHDATSMRLRFTPRARRSRWSQVNRDRAAAMIERGLMTPAGLAAIDRAKANGQWLPAQPTATRGA
jgi:uncharacterized protein YdeI (YjbR/CyaY-like superfamily)